MMKRTFDNSREALAEYDETACARKLKWDEAETEGDLYACIAADKAAWRKVCEAFHRDTSDINSLHNCMLVDDIFVRRLVAGTAEKKNNRVNPAEI